MINNCTRNQDLFVKGAMKLPIFANLSNQEKLEIVSEAVVRKLNKGEVLFSHGDQISNFYVVISGGVKQYRSTPDGRDITIKLSLKGEIVGETHLFESEGHYHWSAEAIEETHVLRYSIKWFREALERNSKLAFNIISAISQYSHKSALAVEHQVSFNAQQRAACFLIKACETHDFNPDNFKLPHSKGIIASKLGMEIETFSRTIKKLQSYGVIIQGNNASIVHPNVVVSEVCNHCSISESCKGLAKLRAAKHIQSDELNAVISHNKKRLERLIKVRDQLNIAIESITDTNFQVEVAQILGDVIDVLSSIKRQHVYDNIGYLLNVVKNSKDKNENIEAARDFGRITRQIS